jgi:hypothetical protein
MSKSYEKQIQNTIFVDIGYFAVQSGEGMGEGTGFYRRRLFQHLI